MNNKATRTTIFGDDKPPLLCLSKSTPTIDNTYNRLEANNAPFLNNYLTPLYKQTLEGQSIYDKKGRRYTYKDNTLYQDELPVIRDIDNYHFESKEITIQPDILDFDISDRATIDNNLYARLQWHTLDNSVHLLFNNREVSSSSLYNDGVIISSRVRIVTIEGEEVAIGIIIYKDDDDNLRYLLITSSNIVTIRPLNFRTWMMRTAASGSWTSSSYSPSILNPLIQISSLGSVAAFSILSNYGSVLRPNETGIYTAFIINQDIFELGSTLIPDNSSITKEVVTQHESYAHAEIYQSFPYETRYCVSVDGNTFYAYNDPDVGEQLDVPISFRPSQLGTIEIDGTTYIRYSYPYYTNTLTVNVFMTNPDGLSWKATIDGVDTEQTTDIEVTYVRTEESFEQTPLTYNTVAVTWNGTTAQIENGKTTFIKTETSTVASVGWLVYPNVVLDNGTMYAVWTFNGTGTNISNDNYFIHSGTLRNITLNSGVCTYTLLTRESTLGTSGSPQFKVRSNSFAFLPNFISQSIRLTNTSTVFTSSPTNNRTTDLMNSNCTDLLWGTGSVDDNLLANYAGGTASDSYPLFTPGGYRASLNEHWNILPYITFDGQCNNLGISYSANEDAMGTLLTSWADINQNFYIKYNTDTLIYRDGLDQLQELSVKEGAIISNIPGDRFVLVNTTSYYNLYDSVLNRKFHYASDYNNRFRFGAGGTPTKEWDTGRSNVEIHTRIVNTGINESYQQINGKYKVCSALFPSLVLKYLWTNEYRTYGCTIPESTDALGIDVYYTGEGAAEFLSNGEPDTSGKYFDYQYTYYPFNKSHTGIRPEVRDTTWSSNGYLYNPNLLSKYIVGSSNNDYILNNNTAYPLVYYGNSSDPIFLYNLTGQLENVDCFFVLQGQFYGIMDDKLYSLVYIDGSISERDAIIDIRGMHYLGNTPSIAFFWSSTQRSFYSFTGDANLQPLFPGSKFTDIDYKGHYYEESSQSIWIPTDRGILVFSPKETYIIEDITDVRNIQFDEENTVHVERPEDTINYRYFPEEGYESNHIKLETSFFGPGAGQVLTVDRWDITLYNPYNVEMNGEIKVGVKSITNCMTTFESEPRSITKEQWDKESNSIRISYSPKLIKGQGIRLLLDSPWPVTSVAPHIADQGHNQTTSNKFEI